jgi:hypothetical protein
MSDPLDPAVPFDPLKSAINMTGKDNVSDPKTSVLDFLSMHSTKRDTLLLERGDTLFHNTLNHYLSVIESAGFENVFELPFLTKRLQDETYFVYARRDGLLLSFDTVKGDKINGSKLYYQWEPDGKYKYGSHLSSGNLCRDESRQVWIGYHDAREGLLRKIDVLTAKGDFVTPWLQESGGSSVSLLHHGDTQGGFESYDSHAITAERIQRMPKWVQDIIGS